MTNPSVVPILSRCKGLITDEGGITCHASIVAREWNIPCIVGTDKATQIFKTGDYIELDAVKGIARKIKIKEK